MPITGRQKENKMYKNSFVVSVKIEDKFMKEDGDSITIPFGSDYSIYLKNLNSRFACVSVEIDGADMLDGNKLIVSPNSSTELKGKINKDLIVENSFRFIKMTDKISEHRGNHPEDGIIRITFDYQKDNYGNTYWVRTVPTVYPRWTDYTIANTNLNNYYSGTMTVNNGIASSSSYSYTATNNSSPLGITVPGKDTFQGFHSYNIGELDGNPSVISFKLFGVEKGKEEFSRTKVICKTCGSLNKNKNKFCFECGTRLV